MLTVTTRKLFALTQGLISRYRAWHRKKRGSMRDFDFCGEHSIVEDIKTKYGYEGPLLKIFAENKGLLVQKWHHYIPIYDKYFTAFRGSKIRFLEIGVSDGGSLQMWREYFGKQAVIFGIDIDPKCTQFDGLSAQVRMGSQTDPKFLRSVIEEMGGVDIVLDDGSHKMQHIMTSLREIFPLLNYGGLYVIEDLHTAYWRKFGGGYHSKHKFFNRIGTIIDDMHHWYHVFGIKEPKVSQDCSAIHVYDSVVILEKNKVYKPVHSRVV